MTTTLSTSLPTATWTIDASHSEVGFTVRHLMSKVRGSFDEFSGQITTTEGDPARSTVQATIEMASVNTRNEQRDAHLRSQEIFHAEAHPQMTFTSTAVSVDGDDHRIDGDLTINGVTRPVSLDAEFLGVDTDAYGAVRLGVEATTRISKSDFGVDFNVPLEGDKLLLGDRVDVTLTIQATRND